MRRGLEKRFGLVGRHTERRGREKDVKGLWLRGREGELELGEAQIRNTLSHSETLSWCCVPSCLVWFWQE